MPTLHHPRDPRAARAGGARFTGGRVRGGHPLPAVLAGAVDVLAAGRRGGWADAMRRAAGSVAETVGRVRGTRATSPRTLRADSGVGGRIARTCRLRILPVSLTVRLRAILHRPVVEIPEEAWIPIPCVLDGADRAETTCGPRRHAGRRSPVTADGPAGRGPD